MSIHWRMVRPLYVGSGVDRSVATTTQVAAQVTRRIPAAVANFILAFMKEVWLRCFLAATLKSPTPEIDGNIP
jgi:hypothetical protein